MIFLCVVHVTLNHASSLDLVLRPIMKEIMGKTSKALSFHRLSCALIWIVCKGFFRPPLFHTATRICHELLLWNKK